MAEICTLLGGTLPRVEVGAVGVSDCLFFGLRGVAEGDDVSLK